MFHAGLIRIHIYLLFGQLILQCKIGVRNVYRDSNSKYSGSGLGLAIVAQILSMQELDFGVKNRSDGVRVAPVSNADKSNSVVISPLIRSVSVMMISEYFQLSHEMKTPLGVIRAYAEGLQDETDEAKKQKYSEIIVLRWVLK